MKPTTLICSIAALISLSVPTLFAQAVPNPLVRPPRTGQQPLQEGGAQPGQPGAQGAQAPQSGAAARGRAATRGAAGARGGDPNAAPDAGAQEKDPVAERLDSLYVVAVIGEVAVLRSLRVEVMPALNGSSIGAGIGASRGGQPELGAAAGGAGGVSPAGSSGAPMALRSQVYTVRNGEILPFMERMRVLARVRNTSVTLYDVTDVPIGSFDPLDLVDRGYPVVFRGALDSVQTPAYVPPGNALERPGGGLDGQAFGAARDTNKPQSSSNSGSRSAIGSAPTGLGTNRNDSTRTP